MGRTKILASFSHKIMLSVFDKRCSHHLRKIHERSDLYCYAYWQVISTLAIDHSGSRVLTGSYDYSVRMYDFQGMNARLQSFRQFEPFEGHQVRTLSWSPTSGQFLCVTGSAQAKVHQLLAFLMYSPFLSCTTFRFN